MLDQSPGGNPGRGTLQPREFCGRQLEVEVPRVGADRRVVIGRRQIALDVDRLKIAQGREVKRPAPIAATATCSDTKAFDRCESPSASTAQRATGRCRAGPRRPPNATARCRPRRSDRGLPCRRRCRANRAVGVTDPEPAHPGRLQARAASGEMAEPLRAAWSWLKQTT